MLTAVAQVCWPRWRPPKERTPPARGPPRAPGGEPAQRSIGGTREHGDPERSPRVAPDARDQSQAEHDAARRDIGRSPQVINSPAVGALRLDVGPSR